MEMYKIDDIGLDTLWLFLVPMMVIAWIIWPMLVGLFKKKEEGSTKEYRDLVPNPEVLLSKQAGFLLVERCDPTCPQSSYVEVFGRRFEDSASIAAAANDVELLRNRGYRLCASPRFLREPPSKEVFDRHFSLYEARLHEWRTTQQGKIEFNHHPMPMPPCDFMRTSLGDEV